MINNYYGKNKHDYMRFNDDLFASYIYSLIADASFKKYSSAIELGAGMGRFSCPLVKNFKKITLIEPVSAYTDILKTKFYYTQNKVSIINTDAEDFLQSQLNTEPVLLFCFHILHHLKYRQRKIIYEFVKSTHSKMILVEPNPFNLLILIQILINSDMCLSEEIEYLKLTPYRLRKEFKKAGINFTSYKLICFLPPAFLNILIRKVPKSLIRVTEKFSVFFPFMSSYQLIIGEGGD
jgi:Ribosomal RNA adenine dimethylase